MHAAVYAVQIAHFLNLYISQGIVIMKLVYTETD